MSSSVLTALPQLRNVLSFNLKSKFTIHSKEQLRRERSSLHSWMSPSRTVCSAHLLRGPNFACVSGKEQTEAHVKNFFQRQDTSFIQQIFKKYAYQHTGEISVKNIGHALKECGVFLNNEEIAVVFKSADLNENGSLSLEEFQAAVKTPTKVEQWADTLPLSKLLDHCLMLKNTNLDDPLSGLCDLGPTELDDVAQVFVTGLRKILADSQLDLQKCMLAMQKHAQESTTETGASSKFQTFKMSSGKVGDFHKGLLERVGAPHPNLKKGMEDEHCLMTGCDVEFVTDNYGVHTTPRKEYEIAIGKRACPRADLLDKTGRPVRVIRRIAELKCLGLVTKAGLLEEEIIAVVLYTGPMYQIYNMLLRRFPEEVCRQYQSGGNSFATTIHILVSAIVKIARVMKLPAGLELYRGLGGLMELPDSFYKGKSGENFSNLFKDMGRAGLNLTCLSQEDNHGCRGYMEWGFLSTTSKKAVAVQYSGISEGRPRATILRAKTGAIDRGACIAELSQYPGEVEYLWAPCAFLEPRGCRMLEFVNGDDGGRGASGVVTVVPELSMD